MIMGKWVSKSKEWTYYGNIGGYIALIIHAAAQTVSIIALGNSFKWPAQLTF
jgi:hypothetical protein